MNLEYKVDAEDAGKSIKNVIVKNFKISSRLLNKLKNNGHILINNKTAFINEPCKKDDIIKIIFDYDEEDDILKEEYNLEVLYEDDWYLAVFKPSNMVVHPSSFHPNGTLANYVKFYIEKSGLKKKIRPVNRLDNGTSGIVLFAKNEYAQERFKFIKPAPIKKYKAIALGILDNKEGIIDAPIARKENSIIERCVDFDNGKKAITIYKVLEEFEYENCKYSILDIRLITGRTHQIRVHLKHLGHPLVGDSLYNENYLNDPLSKNYNSQALSAYYLEFKHPITREKIEILANTDILSSKIER